MTEKLLREIKYSFRQMYGGFSVLELTTNNALIDSITRVEELFTSLEV